MKIRTSIAAVMFILFANVYADEINTVEQGAEGYDWQACLTAKSEDCMNSCMNSDDIHCGDNCSTMAKDKCMTEGLNAP